MLPTEPFTFPTKPLAEAFIRGVRVFSSVTIHGPRLAGPCLWEVVLHDPARDGEELCSVCDAPSRRIGMAG